MKVDAHVVDGKFFGNFYTLDSGDIVYLANKRKSHIYLKKGAWCFELYTLNKAKRIGVKAIGVVVDNPTDGRYIWFTNLEDLWGINSFVPPIFHSKTEQRGLPLGKFKVNPATHVGYISKSIKLR